jgi:hypothetical protein
MITSLCSGVTLGVYVPGLFFNKNLNEAGYVTKLEVYEDLLLTEKLANISMLKKEYHRSFKFALKAREYSHDNNNENLDSVKVDKLLSQWEIEGRDHFIVWSGFWIPIIEKFIEKSHHNVRVDVINVDAILMKSFRPFDLNKKKYRIILPFDWDQQRITCYVNITEDKIVPYSSRNKRFLIHGGGWGIGTYQKKLSQLEERGINLDVILYEENDYSNVNKANRYFMLNPLWSAWIKNDKDEHTYPPFGEILSDNMEIKYSTGSTPDVYSIIKNNLAIISKPGGGTLLDSLSSATPVIFLEPFGDGEEKNSLLFCKLGLGITLEEWLESGCSVEVLEKIHNNIVNLRNSIPNSIQLYYDKK